MSGTRTHFSLLRNVSEKLFPVRTACATRQLPLLLILLLLAPPAVAQAQFNYTTNNGTITITGYTGPGGPVAIPETINGLPVTRIGDFAFDNRTNVTSVTIPNSVTSIGVAAFSYCTGLSNVTIGNGVQTIGNGAFGLCSSLSAITVDALNSFYSSVDGVLFNQNRTVLVRCPEGRVGSYTIPNSVTSIGDSAFFSCRSLTSVTIPTSVASIGGGAFFSCTSLTNATIPNSVTSIGHSAFVYCASLVSVTIPASVTSIGDSAFDGCTSLTAITVDAFNSFYSSVDEVLFNNNQTLLIRYPEGRVGSYTLPNSVAIIGYGAFRSCASLTSATIPSSVTSIGEAAFYYCSSLTSVTIPNSLTSIGNDAFSGCTSLTSVTIPSSVISIGHYAFASCSNLTSVTIPNSVTSIGEAAFYYCSSLTSVTIPNSVTSIGNEAFSGCTSVTSVTIPNSITSIGYRAFASCTSLTSVTIPSSVSIIDGYAFAFCTSLTGVYFQGNAPAFVESAVFEGANNATIYYLPGTTGWGTTFAGRPAVLWNPLVDTTDASFGVRTNRFGFTITGASNLVLVVEASTSLANPAWIPVGTNTLVFGSSYFGDPQWTNYPARFYRLRSP